mgnify:CR=1 FL=1
MDAGETWEQVHLLPHLGEPSLTVLPHDVKGVGELRCVRRRQYSAMILILSRSTVAGPVVVLDARCPDGRGHYPGPAEPCNCDCRGVATSTDGGTTWGQTSYDPSVPDPDCQGAILALSNGSVIMSNPNSATDRINLSVRLGDVLVRCEEEAVVTWAEEAVSLSTPQTFGAYSSIFQTPDGKIGVLWETEGDQASRGCTGGSCSIVLSFL